MGDPLACLHLLVVEQDFVEFLQLWKEIFMTHVSDGQIGPTFNFTFGS